MRCAIHLLLSTIHHFRVGERSGLSGLIGFGQVFRLRDEGRKSEAFTFLRYERTHNSRREETALVENRLFSSLP